MLNNAARKLILEVSPEGIAWYDWWIGSVISIAGIVVHVEGVDTVYRIHSNNLIGIPSKFNLINRLKQYRNNIGFIQSLNLTKFANSFGDENSKKEIQIWVNGHSGALCERLKFSIFDKKRRKNIIEDIFRRIKSIRGLNLPE
jgi:hypothetical protein